MNMAKIIKIPIAWLGPITGGVVGVVGLLSVYITTMYQTESAIAQQAAVIENVKDDIVEIKEDQDTEVDARIVMQDDITDIKILLATMSANLENISERLSE